MRKGVVAARGAGSCVGRGFKPRRRVVRAEEEETKRAGKQGWRVESTRPSPAANLTLRHLDSDGGLAGEGKGAISGGGLDGAAGRAGWALSGCLVREHASGTRGMQRVAEAENETEKRREVRETS